MLVTGATGFVGPRLVPALVEAGHDVAALVRDAARYEAPNGVRVVEGDRLEVPETAGETYEIGGPDVLAPDDAGTDRPGHGSTTRHRASARAVPRTLGLLGYLVTSVPASGGPPADLRAPQPVVVTDERIRDLDSVELTRFDEVIERALAADHAVRTADARPA